VGHRPQHQLFTVQLVFSDMDADLVTVSLRVDDLVESEQVFIAAGTARHFPGDPMLTTELQRTLDDLWLMAGEQLRLF